MKASSFMLIAGEPSGDLLAAELVNALTQEAGSNPKSEIRNPNFFGAGGPKMADAGVDLAFDLTQHAVVGTVEVLKHLRVLKQLFDRLVELAFARRPDVIVCVDFSVFNHRFARKLRWELEVRRATHGNWKPKIVKFVSPQVWASRPRRANAMARDFDLLLTIFPFEKPWYAERVPGFPVEFVGHPMLDRYANAERGTRNAESSDAQPTVLLLPGSRAGELKRHLPPMLGALEKVQSARPEVLARMVLPNESMAALAFWEFVRRLGLKVRLSGPPALKDAQAMAAKAFPSLELRLGTLSEALPSATVAIASTGTVTMECAYFGVPTVALYKTSWSTYQIGRRIIQVKYLAMPNLLANEGVFPELIQHEATAENIARAALDLLNNAARRESIRRKLEQVVESLGGPGAAKRAAQAILKLA